MTLPAAGWYDDPADTEQLRWWTGDAWSEVRERREPAAPAPAGVAVPDPALPWAANPSLPLPYGPASVTGLAAASAPPPQPQSPPQSPPRQRNLLALVGMLVGLAALAFNPLGAPGLLTLVLGVLGLRRANGLKQSGAPATGFGLSIAALVFGGIACMRVLG